MIKLAVQDGERFNTFSHLLGAFVAFCGVVLLMTLAWEKHDVTRMAACLVYSISTVTIYILSVLYHASYGPQKRFFRKLDYIGIYFKIAGNITPYMILAASGFGGWSVLLTVWTLAALGILIEVYFEPKTRLYSNIIYFVMSASVIPTLGAIARSVTAPGFALIMIGFVSYMIGFYFFINDRKIRHAHGIWHVFVMGGSLCQYLCLALYVV